MEGPAALRGFLHSAAGYGNHADLAPQFAVHFMYTWLCQSCIIRRRSAQKTLADPFVARSVAQTTV